MHITDTDRATARTGRTVREDGPIFMDGPVLVFGGCYGNLEATRALLARARALDIPPQRVVCTGDVVAYCADARATAALIRESGVHVVMGNCEESLGHGSKDCGCAFSEGSLCDILAAAWYDHADHALTEDDRAWMRTLPRRLDIVVGKRRLAVVHGGLDLINRYVFASTQEDELRHQLDLAGCDGVIGGHCGLPFTRFVEDKVWHNSGAIGMPANDGTRRTWFSLLTPAENGIRIQHLALDYDPAETVSKMRANGLPEDYARTLETGLWPSCDILPEEELTRQGAALHPGTLDWPLNDGNRGSDASADTLWPSSRDFATSPLQAKFSDPERTATGERRASVALTGLETLWINTGTLCNLECINCYIESSPRNDRLVYITRAEGRTFLEEAQDRHPELREIGFTGGEPFMNPDIIGLLEDALSHGYKVLVLTNAMKPMHHKKAALLDLHRHHPGRLTVRVSIDHYRREEHERMRGPRSWQPTIDGLLWLSGNGFDFSIAGRTLWEEDERSLRRGFAALLKELGVAMDCDDPARLVLFPEMDEQAEVPEITERCWSILGKRPEDVMCATSRMVVKRKGAERPEVVSCTLLPYDERFSMGHTLAEAGRPVKLNHRHCAKFCVLGGASCSPHK